MIILFILIFVRSFRSSAHGAPFESQPLLNSPEIVSDVIASYWHSLLTDSGELTSCFRCDPTDTQIISS
jgi:hypothetical protein